MISDEAVEAAAEAAHLSKLTGVRWDDIPQWKKVDRLSEARAALEAAAPYVAAEAWDEGRESVDFDSCGLNPYRSQA